jgi:[ribosomal protein S18]-alanine N-acetyltransferase
MNDIEICTVADLDALFALEQASFSSDQLSRRQFRAAFNNPRAFFLKLTEAERLIGYGLVFLRSRGASARLYSLCIAKDARGGGRGARLLLALEQAAHARGARRMSLEVRRSNRAARKLYERAGYQLRHGLPGYYADGADGVSLEKALP